MSHSTRASNARIDVFVVGSINTDFSIAVERWPKPGETLAGSDLFTSAGGKGGNQASAVGRLGGHVALLARIGDDARGHVLRDALRAMRVDDRYVLVTAQRATGCAVITVGPDGENTIVVSPGANAAVSSADVDRATSELRAARVVLAQLELSSDVVERALAIAARGGARPILNAAPARELAPSLFALLDPLVVNEHEAAFFLGAPFAASDARDAARRLVARGARSAVVTLGGAGAAGAEADGTTFHVAAPPTEVIDTTGAGDAFVGALAYDLARGATLATAMAFAVRAGSFAVRKYGAQASLPTSADLEAGR